MRSEECWKGRTTYKAPQYPFITKVMILLISIVSFFILLDSQKVIILQTPVS